MPGERSDRIIPGGVGQCIRVDNPGRCLGHDSGDTGTFAPQGMGEADGLHRCNAPGHPEDDPFFGKASWFHHPALRSST